MMVKQKEDHSELLREFQELDTDGDGNLRKRDLNVFIENHAELWAMLGVNLGISDARCREIAKDVIISLINTSSGRGTAIDFTIDEQQFEAFNESYVRDPRGQQEFFHRTVFAVYDADNNGYLNSSELSTFLDVFYDARSIFKGDARLPPKEELQSIVLENISLSPAKHQTGRITFEEIHALISGKMELNMPSLNSAAAGENAV